MSDLVAFLRARLDDDERATQEAEECYPSPWVTDGEGTVSDGLGGEVCFGEFEHHIARWDPARVLAEVAAKRRIVALHDHAHGCSSYNKVHREVDNCYWVGEGDSCSTLVLLALPYADHPDYDLAWAVEDDGARSGS